MDQQQGDQIIVGMLCAGFFLGGILFVGVQDFGKTSIETVLEKLKLDKENREQNLSPSPKV